MHKLKTRWLIAGMLIVAALGAAVTVYLSRHHYNFLAGRLDGASFCNVSNVINCDAVTASPYAEIFGVASSSWGLAFYLVVVLLLVGWLAELDRQRISINGTTIVLLTGIEIVHSVFLLFVQLGVIKAICLLCCLHYFLNIGIFFGALWLLKLTNSDRIGLKRALTYPFVWIRDRLVARNWKKPAGFAFLIVLVVMGTLLWDRSMRKIALRGSALQLEKMLERMREASVVELDVKGSPVLGNSAAPLTIVEFSDFACPFCKRAAAVAKAVLRSYGERVRLVFKHYPLDSACNVNMQRSMHPGACLMARAAYCADQQGQFWPYHDRLFELEEDTNRKAVLEVAANLGLNTGLFESCLDSGAAHDQIQRDILQGQNFGVSGTPAFFFNGRPVVGFIPAPVLKALIDESLKSAAASTRR